MKMGFSNLERQLVDKIVDLMGGSGIVATRLR